MTTSRPLPRVTLILGGIRSGKSALAERLVDESGLAPIYLATAEPGDDEMAERIARHLARRGRSWRTVEEPLALADALVREADIGRAVLIDCLTLWLTNLMMGDRDIEREIADLVQALVETKGPVVLVSNEVGQGLVPTTPLGRKFVDHAGRLHQEVARMADDVALMVAGLPLWLKQSGSSTRKISCTS
jgi:adenosylcobinamide kinase / adenosylcobinamide-phosphate guanylyltransferase